MFELADREALKQSELLESENLLEFQMKEGG